MSGTHATRLAQLRDPTQTEALRGRFLRAVKRLFRELRGAVRSAVGYERDVFGLRAQLAPGDDIQDFPREEATRAFFLQWLRDQIRSVLLDPEGREAVRRGTHWTAPYIRDAYAQGWELATNRLRVRGVSVGTTDIEAALQRPIPTQQLRRLYSRTFDNWRDITSDMVPQIRRTLTEGLAEGINPREMATRLTDEIRTIQHTRAETLARTEIIHSHAEATLDRYDQAGVNGVTVSGEFATADDERVCPICESIEGTVYSIDELRTATFAFDPSESEDDHLAGEYPVKPPVHPRCRCAILPVVG